MSEMLVLDPEEEAIGRVEFDLTPFVGETGPDWGDAEIDAYMAELARGQVPVDFRLPNRIITIPLVILTRAGRTFEEVRLALQSKVGLYQREGGLIKRVINGTPWYADIVNATLRMGGSTAQALLDTDADAVLTLETIPDWYGSETELGEESGTGEIVTTFAPGKGDHPGRVRIVVTDTESARQLGLLWGIRSRHYSADPTAALSYEAEDLTPLDPAAVATLTGASGGGSNNVVQHPAITSQWTSILATDFAGDPLTHTGSYRVWARCYTTSATPPRLRFAWSIGSLTNPKLNAPAAIPGSSQLYNIDLGEIRLDSAPIGAHRWRGQVQAIGAGGEDVAIDKLWFQPVDEFAGVLRAPSPNPLTDELRGAVDLYDGFDQSSGALSTKPLPSGGAWGGAGAATDFQVGSSKITRTATGESAWAGHHAMVATYLFKDYTVEAFITPPVTGTLLFTGVGGFIDTNNWLIAGFEANGSTLKIVKRVGGTVTVIDSKPIVTYPTAGMTLRLTATSSGDYALVCIPADDFSVSPMTGRDPDIGQSLYFGSVGIYSEKRGGGSVAVSLDNFKAWAPESDAVVHALQALELRTDGMYRETTDSGVYGPVTYVQGDLPRLPAAGLENRPVEILIKPSRGDFDQLPDTAIDALDMQVLYRPSWLFVPDSGPGS